MKRGFFLLILSFVCSISSIISAQQITQHELLEKYNCTEENCYFIENKGQWPAEVKYLSRIGGVDAWITSHGIVYDFYRISRANDQKLKPEPSEINISNKTGARRYGQVVRIDLEGTNSNANYTGADKKDSYFNYFIGSDPAKWTSNSSLYTNTIFENVYDKIDVRYYFDEGKIRYDYVLNPGADISSIRMKISGADAASVINNELIIKTGIGEVKHSRLKAYQLLSENLQNSSPVQQDIECSFTQHADGTFGFIAKNYDASKQLIIDPLVYSTFIGGSSEEVGRAVAVDVSGNVYITGETTSANFPTSTGAYDGSQNSYNDIFVTKLNSAGTSIVYSTFIGGSNHDYGYSLALDASGNIYVTGAEASGNFPVTSLAYDQIQNGDYDAFVTKLNPTGTALLYSTLLGWTGRDYATAIAIDGQGNAYISGITQSSNFPVSSNAYDQTYNSGKDAFVVKFNSTGTSLTYSTYLGGTGDDTPYAIALDQSGYVYVAGSTLSTDFPVTSSVFGKSPNGNYDAFVAKLNLSEPALVFSTFLGGSGIDEAYGIALDANKNIYVTGATASSNFPVTSGVYDKTLNGNYDAFVTKLDPAGTALVYSTFVGGTNADYGNAITIDGSGNAFVTGLTLSSDFPVAGAAYDQSYNSGNDVFVSEFNPSGSSLLYSSFIGGGGDEEGTAIALSGSSDLLITGYSTSADYPVTTSAYSHTASGGNDVFITKLKIETVSSGSLALVYNQIDASSFQLIKSYVTVTDQTGQSVSGLSGTNFTVKENGTLQSPITVTPVGTGNNISVALVLDKSGSMDGQPIEDAKAAASQFVDQMLSGDNGAVISFNDIVSVDQPFTSDKTALKNSINLITSSSTTAMYDALNQALNLTQLQNGRKAIIVMTDGEDNSSTYSKTGIINYAKKVSIPIFTIGLGTSMLEDSLKQIAQETGGQYYAAPSSSDLASIYQKISQQLNTQYLITYTTGNAACGGSARTVNITVNYNSQSDNKEKQYTPPACNSTASIKPVSPAIINAGSEFWVDINVGDPVQAVNLFGLSFRLNFNSSYFTYISAVAGSWFGTNLAFYATPDQANGSVSISVSRQYPATGINGSGVIVRVKFKALSTILTNAQIKFFLSNLSATDGNGGTVNLSADSSSSNLIASLTVWPGDTNNDGKVDQSDVLPLGVYWNASGNVRTNPSLQWLAQMCQQWTIPAATYADATGDGKVDQSEVLAIGMNWSKTHSAALSKNLKKAVVRTAGFLYLEEIEGTGGDRVAAVKFQQAEGNNPMPLGISFELAYDSGIKITGIENGDLWSKDAVSLFRDNSLEKRAGFGITNKIGNTTINGSGTVAKVKFRFEEGINGAKMNLNNIKANDVEGVDLNIKNSNMLTLLGEGNSKIPGEFYLKQNYPNPFNPTTVIEYALPKESNVKLVIYNLLGEEVTVLVNEKQNAGYHNVAFDAFGFSSGTYIYKITAGDQVSIRKCILLK